MGPEGRWAVAVELKVVRKKHCWADESPAAQERAGDGPCAVVGPVADVVAPRTHVTVDHRH